MLGALRAAVLLACLLVAPVARADPDALAHLDRGIAAYRLADYPTARRELDLAVELAPDRANPYRWRALVELAQHDCANAVVDIESFLSRVPAGDDRVGELTAQRDRCVAAARPEPLPPPPPPAETSITHRWWFWTAIGAAVVTGATITYAATRTREAMLPIVHCDANGCHP